MESLNILILSTSPTSKATKLFVESAKRRGHKPIVKNPQDLYLFISESERGYDRIYSGENDEVERIQANTIDAIIPRIHSGINYGVKMVRHFNQNLGIYSIQSASGIRAAADKMETSQKLSIAGVKTPMTILAAIPKHIKFLFEKIGGLPAIAKTWRGSLGVGVMILESKLQTNTTIETLYKANVDVLLQRYVDGNFSDIRAIVCGDEVIAAMKRTGKKDEFRANLAQGGRGEAIELSQADKDLCIAAAKSINLEVCGVDLLKDQNDQSFIIEVNAAFGTKIQDLTGIDVTGKIIEHIEKNYKRTKTTQNISSSQVFVKEIEKSFDQVYTEFMNKNIDDKNICICFMKEAEKLNSVEELELLIKKFAN